MKSKSPNESVICELSTLDTCQWSLLHYLFTKPPIQKPAFLRSHLVPYVITAALFYGLPLIVAWIKVPNILFSDPTTGLKVGFLDDWNMMFMNLVTLPVLVIFTLAERNVIPNRINSIIKAGVVSAGKTSNNFASSWNKIYRIVNLLAQIAGIIVAFTVALANYKTGATEGYSGWQFTRGCPNAAGWIFLCWQIPFFYWVVSVYIIQGLATIALLLSFSRHFKIEVSPFHHDNCCGLKAVGQIGLRNQRLLAVAGLNILALFAVFFKRGDPNTVHLLVASAATYIIFGPLVFIGPLLPFRKSMLVAKEEEQANVAASLQHEYKRIRKELKNRPMTKEDEELIDRLQKLKILVNRIPVWPFDTSTLRRFFTAYILPFLTVLVSILVHYLLKILGVVFAT